MLKETGMQANSGRSNRINKYHMRHVFIFIFLSVFSLSAQPTLEWQRALGGTGGDDGFAIRQTTDGGYIVAGFSTSFNGDVSGGHGATDCWIVKLNVSGVIEWQRMYGGTGSETAESIQQTSDNGYIFVGKTNSNNGDVNLNKGGRDIWVVKLKTNGELDWQRVIGGSGDEEADAVLETIDGGFLIVGYTDSADGDVTNNNGGLDMWVIKLNKTGIIEWEETYGGSNPEYAHSICSVEDGGFIIAGETWSNNGDVIGNNGDTDVWVIKIDSIGNLKWQNAIGGSGADVAWKIHATNDGDYLLIGTTGSNNTGDVFGSHGLFECWLVKLDEMGDIVWQKTLGGSDNDYGSAIAVADDGSIVVGGVTRSFDGDVTSNNWPGSNWWVVKLDSTGVILWDRVYGGSAIDFSRDLQLTSDGGLIMTGHTYSSDGDITGFHGGIDMWVVKLNADGVSLVVETRAAALQMYPNPAGDWLQIELPAGNALLQVALRDALGRICPATWSGAQLNTSGLPAGLYYLSVTDAEGNWYAGKFRKE
jgi:hypothetical protein